MSWFHRKGISKSPAGELRRLRFGRRPSEAELQAMTEKYQNDLRNSTVFDELVEKYGRKKAEELIKECKLEIR